MRYWRLHPIRCGSRRESVGGEEPIAFPLAPNRHTHVRHKTPDVAAQVVDGLTCGRLFQSNRERGTFQKGGRVVCLSKQSRRPTQNKKGTNSIRRSSVEIAAAVFRPLFNWTESSSSCLYLATAQTLHTKWQSPRRLPPLCCCCCSVLPLMCV